jgi:polyferredoxin
MRFFTIAILTSLLLATTEVWAQGGHGHGRSGMSVVDLLLRPKFIAMTIIGLIALVLLMTRKLNDGRKLALLLVSTFLFGIASNLPVDFLSGFSMHPSPLCAAAKPFLFGLRLPFLATLIVIFALTLVGPKLFCGYICPVGTLQELLSMLAERLRWKNLVIPFRVSNTIRIGFFLTFLAVSVTGVLSITTQRGTFAVSLYDYVNAFHGFQIVVPTSFRGFALRYLPLLLTIVLALRLYRPFCYLVCPVGLYTHLLEQIGLLRVTKIHSTCNDCDLCVIRARCPTVPDILNRAQLRPDCFACNRCVAACSKRKALTWGLRRTVGSKEPTA